MRHCQKKSPSGKDEPRKDRQVCRESLWPLLVHACVTPTRQAMMMMQMQGRAVGDHALKVSDTPTQVNRFGATYASERGGEFGFLGRQNCATRGL